MIFVLWEVDLLWLSLLCLLPYHYAYGNYIIYIDDYLKTDYVYILNCILACNDSNVAPSHAVFPSTLCTSIANNKYIVGPVGMRCRIIRKTKTYEEWEEYRKQRKIITNKKHNTNTQE